MDTGRPQWATRLQTEREARGWGKREMARRLYAAAGFRSGNVASLAKQVGWHESGDHFPTEWGPHYAMAFGIPEHALFGRDLVQGQRRPAEQGAVANLGDVCRSDLVSEAAVGTAAVGDEFLDAVEPLLVVSERGPIPVSSSAGVSIEQVMQVEAATAIFRSWDNQYGGGLRRKAVVGQLSEVAGLLKGPFAGPVAGQRLYAAVADLTQLAGFMSFDARLHGLAQRYFTLGLRLAKEAGDRLQAARMLYCLARQMIELDEPGSALDLAQSGQYVIRRAGNPRVAAMLHAMEGRAFGGMGDAQGCRRALAHAADDFESAGTDDGPAWTAFFSRVELLGISGVALRDLSLRHLEMADERRAGEYAAEASPYIAQAAQGRSQDYLRSRVLDLDGLAVVSYLSGDPGRAADALHQALDIAAPVNSARAKRNLHRTIRLGRSRYGDLPEVRDLHDRARTDLSELE